MKVRSLPRPAKAPAAAVNARRTLEPIGVRTIVSVFAIGAVFTALGFWQVRAVFEARDYQMATRSLQEQVQARRDQTREMTSRTSHLQSGDSMRQAALNTFGMTDPNPAEVAHLHVSKEATERWAEADRKAETEIAKLRRGWNAARKDGATH